VITILKTSKSKAWKKGFALAVHQGDAAPLFYADIALDASAEEVTTG